ncbi:hypothetical protein BDV95DRAFT_595895 [Massariosphaeria phaeospora]|uniref:Pyridoxamine 5'-phosphate oxidase putative domain-containing protein n=1 Tax=Massariosphaeria phaeospora TaxID=100035 RepID=A0A7C8I434_9PLEO|nr:hypothetical protein BDV95DRAFT_595895 [Massariosphaeria phaeospora]
MGIFYETIPPSLQPWILAQKMLWVASAPLSASGHINLSPKGGPYFGIANAHTFWFLDLTGSGIETTAHLREPGNGRICVVFMAFEGAPRIVRIWGSGTAVENGSPEFERLVQEQRVEAVPGARSVVVVHVQQVASSCGFSVPCYEFKGYRSVLNDFFAKKERAFRSGKADESMDQYWAYKSQLSIDGLPGMKRGYDYAQKHGVAPLKKMIGPWAPTAPRTVKATPPMQVIMVAVLSFIIGIVLTLSVASPETVRRIQQKEGFF